MRLVCPRRVARLVSCKLLSNQWCVPPGVSACLVPPARGGAHHG